MSTLRTTTVIFLSLFSCILSANGGDKPLKLPKHLKQNFIYVAAGSAIVDGQKLDVNDFYIYRQELSNIDYQEFLYDLKANGEDDVAKLAGIDSSGWRMKGVAMEPFVANYHKHPAYHEYPVVNISYDAAIAYCRWLTERLNENPDAAYHVEARLPTRAEWLRAASPADVHATYAWGGSYLRNDKGNILCNFRDFGPEQITRNPETDVLEIVTHTPLPSGNIFTAPVLSYLPSPIGLHNMNGNVAEMLDAEGIAAGGSWNSPGYDVRNASVSTYEKPTPMLGFRPVLVITEK